LCVTCWRRECGGPVAPRAVTRLRLQTRQERPASADFQGGGVLQGIRGRQDVRPDAAGRVRPQCAGGAAAGQQREQAIGALSWHSAAVLRGGLHPRRCLPGVGGRRESEKCAGAHPHDLLTIAIARAAESRDLRGPIDTKVCLAHSGGLCSDLLLKRAAIGRAPPRFLAKVMTSTRASGRVGANHAAFSR